MNTNKKIGLFFGLTTIMLGAGMTIAMAKSTPPPAPTSSSTLTQAPPPAEPPIFLIDGVVVS